jgi:hypothetical protein
MEIHYNGEDKLKKLLLHILQISTKLSPLRSVQNPSILHILLRMPSIQSTLNVVSYQVHLLTFNFNPKGRRQPKWLFPDLGRVF